MSSRINVFYYLFYIIGFILVVWTLKGGSVYVYISHQLSVTFHIPHKMTPTDQTSEAVGAVEAFRDK